jgi:alanine dehydrogenase
MNPAPKIPTASPATLVLTRADIARLMTLDDYVTAAEEAFTAVSDGRAEVPAPLHLAGDGGALHGKGATIRTQGGRLYAAVKINANFPSNKQPHALPTIQGAVLLFDASNGRLLAVMDSIEVTLQRTAAATALAARYLARKDAVVATIIGCGDQARAQLAFLARELTLARIHAVDIDEAAATGFARHMTKSLDLDVRPARDMAGATSVSDVIVTCTTARTPFLRLSDVRPGTFIAAVGADSPAKSELFPDLVARAKVVVDSLEQCMVMGDLHHAIAAGTMTASTVHATLGELVTARKPGRTSEDEITVFDSTGIAAQDAAAAIRIFERAQMRKLGLICRLADTSPALAREHWS